MRGIGDVLRTGLATRDLHRQLCIVLMIRQRSDSDCTSGLVVHPGYGVAMLPEDDSAMLFEDSPAILWGYGPAMPSEYGRGMVCEDGPAMPS